MTFVFGSGSPPGPPGPPGASSPAYKSDAQAKVEAILNKGLDEKGIVKELQEAIDQVILESIVEPGGSKDYKSEQEFVSILQGCADLYAPHLVSGYARLDEETRQAVQEMKREAIAKNISELKKELQKIKEDLPSSRMCQNRIEAVEAEIQSLRGEYLQARQILQRKPSDKQLIEDCKIVVERVEDKEAELKSLRELKKGDPLPPSFSIALPEKHLELARLEERLLVLDAIAPTLEKTAHLPSTDPEGIRSRLRQNLKIYYGALAKQQIRLLMTEADIKLSEAVTSLSEAQSRYVIRLKKDSPDVSKELAALGESVEMISAKAQAQCEDRKTQKLANVNLSNEMAKKMLTKHTLRICDSLASIETLVDQAIEKDLSVQVSEIKKIAAYEKTQAISRVAVELGLENKTTKQKNAEKEMQAASSALKLVSSRSEASEPLIFDFDRETTLYTMSDLCSLAIHFGFDPDVSTMNEELTKHFSPFKKLPAPLDAKQMAGLEKKLKDEGHKGLKRAGDKDLKEAKLLYQPRECIELVLNIIDINAELLDRQKKKSAENKGSQEPKNDDNSSDDGVAFHTTSDGVTSDSDSDGEKVMKASIKKMVNLTAEFDALSKALAEERKARLAAEKDKLEAERKHAEVIALAQQGGLAAVLTPEQIRSQQIAKQLNRRPGR